MKELIKGNLKIIEIKEGQIYEGKKTANSNSKSRIRGVHWCKSKKKWITTLTFKKALVLNKSFNNIEDAIKARKEAEEKYFKPILDKYKAEQN